MTEILSALSNTVAPYTIPRQRHVLHRDFETRSKVSLKKVGAHRYAADPSTENYLYCFRRR